MTHSLFEMFQKPVDALLRDVKITEIQFSSVVQLMVHSTEMQAFSDAMDQYALTIPEPGCVTHSALGSLLAIAPDTFQLFSNANEQGEAALFNANDFDCAFTIDLTHSHRFSVLEGAGILRPLSRLLPIDLKPQLQRGDFALQTVCEGISVIVWSVAGEKSVYLGVPTSYNLALNDIISQHL